MIRDIIFHETNTKKNVLNTGCINIKIENVDTHDEEDVNNEKRTDKEE